MDVGLNPDAYWAELLAMGASDEDADAARSELVRQQQEAAR
jgi:hypothetical protein